MLPWPRFCIKPGTNQYYFTSFFLYRSISKDKNVRVWDLRDYSCKQSIPGRIIGLGRFYITAAYFNERLKELVVATNKIGVLQPGNLVTTSKKQKQSQNNLKPVVRVLYNPVFNQVNELAKPLTLFISEKQM